jgi:hypothetical protein
VEHRKLSRTIGGGLCASSFGLILASVVSHLAGSGLYLFLIIIFLLGVALFVRAAGPGHVKVQSVAEPRIGPQMPTLPPPSPPVGDGLYADADMEAEVEEPFVAGNLLRINVASNLGRDGNGKYYAEAFGIEGRFPARLLPGPWRVPWNDAPGGRPRYISWRSTDLRLAEWPDSRRYGRRPGGIGRARMTFLEAGDRVKRRKAWGTGPWHIVVRLRREGSDAYTDTAFDIRLEAGQIVFQKA